VFGTEADFEFYCTTKNIKRLLAEVCIRRNDFGWCIIKQSRVFIWTLTSECRHLLSNLPASYYSPLFPYLLANVPRSPSRHHQYSFDCPSIIKEVFFWATFATAITISLALRQASSVLVARKEVAAMFCSKASRISNCY
jgi:hypothetical protein